MTANPEPVNAMATPLVTVTPEPATATAAGLTPAAAWSRRVRRVGGFIQAAFAAFWLGRASPLWALAKPFGVRPYYDRWDTRI